MYFVIFQGFFLSSSFTKLQQPSINLLVEEHFAKFQVSLDSLEIAFNSNKPLAQQQYYYNIARKNYKYLETVIEFIASSFSKFYINGPPIKKHSFEMGNQVIDPHGFQVLESALFADDTSLTKETLVNEIQIMKEYTFKAQKKYANAAPGNEQFLNMIQMELVRITSLNFNGYDCTITKENITETKYVFDGIEDMLESICNNNTSTPPYIKLKKLIKEAKNYLLANKDYDTFNRLYFITTYINPIYSLVYDLRVELSAFPKLTRYAINFNEKELFGRNFFNESFFNANLSDTTNRASQIELGRNLFFDPILSGNNQRACASCHKPELAFSDTIPTNFEFNKTGFLKRNTPTLLNAKYQKSFFYDGRSLNLEAQINDVLHAKLEMNAVPEEVVSKLKQSDDYKQLFKKAYKGHNDTVITYYGVVRAIKEFERTLVSTNSKFDNYLHGDKTALNAQEINGYTLFSGKALCGSCHFFPLFNGLVPPFYKDNEFEVIGTLKGPNAKVIDPDSGRITFTKKDIHLFSFKTPTVRNIEKTYPYMHNGNYKTLDQIIDFYNKGGSAVITQKIENQTLPFDSLQLSNQEKLDIKSFLLTLNDNPYTDIRPKKLPVFKNPLLNKRKIGGEY